jgi:hypothetical protein
MYSTKPSRVKSQVNQNFYFPDEDLVNCSLWTCIPIYQQIHNTKNGLQKFTFSCAPIYCTWSRVERYVQFERLTVRRYAGLPDLEQYPTPSVVEDLL